MILIVNKEQLDMILEGLDCLEEMDGTGYPPLGKEKIDMVRQQIKSAKEISSSDLDNHDRELSY